MEIESKGTIALCLQPYLLCTDCPNRLIPSPLWVLIFQVLVLDWTYGTAHVEFSTVHCEAYSNTGTKMVSL